MSRKESRKPCKGFWWRQPTTTDETGYTKQKRRAEMFTGKYELVILYTNGTREVYTYKDRQSAEKAEENMHMACGNQIAWSCTRQQFA